MTGKYASFFLLPLLLAAPLLSFAQGPLSAHWYFGRGAGVDFNSGFPVADTNSAMTSAIEGGCSISDTAGNLLFYSDGQKVWNRNHAMMPYGYAITGNGSSVQSCLIAPFPGHASQYYLFTNGYSTNGNYAEYSIIDMSLDSGRGDVTGQKNVALFQDPGEELAGTMHCNAKDYWIVFRERVGNGAYCVYHRYLLDSFGLSQPLSDTLLRANHPVGHLAFSQDGSLLSSSFFMSNSNYIYSFDRQTGAMVMQDSLYWPSGSGDWFYSAAFSPDNSKLYTVYWEYQGYCYVSQFDRNAPNLYASRVDVDSVAYFNGSTNGYGWIGRMQLASDQKIYISRWGFPGQWCPVGGYCVDSLDVIHYPDSAGLACMHQRGGALLDGKPTMIGLPSFVSQFTEPGIPQPTCDPNGVAETFAENKFTVFPNPFSDGATVRLDRFEKGTTFEVYDAGGKLIRRQPVTSARFYFDAAGLQSGIYFCRIVLSDRILTEKLVIVR